MRLAVFENVACTPTKTVTFKPTRKPRQTGGREGDVQGDLENLKPERRGGMHPHGSRPRH
jgi:hypothetical protein